MNLTGQVALVTGAGRGLGRAFAIALARSGASIGAIARSAAQVRETSTLIEKSGGRSVPIVADVTAEGALKSAVAEVERRFGPLDLLVSAAGLGRPFGPTWEVDAPEWWRTVEVNLRGPFLGIQAALPGMLERGRGRIINVSSGAGNVAIPHLSAYATSKTALTRLTEIVAVEIGERPVSIFAIEPGTVRTAMTEEALTPDAKRWVPWLGQIFAEGKDVSADYAAGLVVWLASGAGDRLTGRFISRLDDLDALLQAAPSSEDRRKLRLLP